MVDFDRINAEIERLRNLNADEYLAEAFEKMRADFEETRAEKIRELERAIEIFNEYQVEDEQEDEQAEEQAEEQNDYIEE